MGRCAAPTTRGPRCRRLARPGALTCAQHTVSLVNPKTGKQWTVAELLDAIRSMNEIANRQANRHGYCSQWELIMRVIVHRTGLPLEGRPNSMRHNSMTIEDEVRWDVEMERVQQGGRPT